MSTAPTAPGRRHLAGCGWFWAWAAVGIGAALAAVSLGPILMLPVAVLAVTLARRPSTRRSAFGALSGAGLLLLYIAYLQRDGPGVTCWHTATASGCDQHLNPIPWLAIGLACVVGGIVGHTRHSK